MIRQARHERKIVNDFKIPPFALRASKDEWTIFRQPANACHLLRLVQPLDKSAFV